MLPAGVAQAAESAHRESWGRVLAATLRLARDLDIAEEATADAFALALEAWPTSGIPESVDAWLLTVARRRAVDRIRRAEALRRRLALLVADAAVETSVESGPADRVTDAPVLADDELRLVVLCAHPALDVAVQVALTLRLGCGVSTEAVAAAFLVPTPTMAARLTRAKRRIAVSGAAIDLPDEATVDLRLPAVRAALHLAYCFGHTAAGGAGLRDDALAERALRLVGSLHAARPADPETEALLGLCLLSHARRDARIDPDGGQVLFDDMDRGRWDRAALERGRRHVRAAVAGGPSGPMALRARLADAMAADPGPDWPDALRGYDALLRVEPSPTSALGRCLALSRVVGPARGLADLDEVLALGGLERHPYAHARRARLLGELDRAPEARRAWIRAAACARTDAERAYFSGRAAG